MADSKQTKLSIIIATVDKATAKIQAINAKLDAATKPTRNLKKALSELGEKSGLSSLVGGFKDVGSAVGDLLGKVAMIGGVAALAVAGVFHLVDKFDDLGKKAERLGVSVDYLASLRYAAEKTGVPVEALDQGLETFSINLGKAQAGTGRMAAFLRKVNPEFLKQLQHAKNSQEAFADLADALEKEHDVARKAALANAALGDPKLATLLSKGSAGVKELQDRYAHFAGSQKEAAERSAKVKEAMIDLHASMDGVEAAIVEGLAPALQDIVGRLAEWFTAHREDVREWADKIGKALPGAIETVRDKLESAVSTVSSFIDKIGGVKNLVIGLAAVMAGPLIASLAKVGIAIMTNPALLEVTAMVAAVIALNEAVDGLFDSLPEGSLTDPVGTYKKLKEKKARDEQAAAAAASGGGVIQGARRTPLNFRSLDMSGQANSLRPDLAAQSSLLASGAGAAPSPPQTAKVTVDFMNMPRGGRAKVDPQSDADVDLSVGYNLLGATP